MPSTAPLPSPRPSPQGRGGPETLPSSQPSPQGRGGPPTLGASPLRADTLADSFLLLMALLVLQRLVGFGREILFCRWLDAEQLGQWEMAFGFLMLAGPLAVLSLPGTFGRYVERYRQQGQMRTFLRRTAGFCAALAVPAAVGVYLGRAWFSQLIFRTPEQAGLVVLLSGGLLAIVMLNYFISLLTALRNIRLVSVMDLASSLLFALLAVGLLAAGHRSAGSVVIAYAGANLLTAGVGLWWLVRCWPSLPQAASPRRSANCGRGCCPSPPGSS